MKISSVVERVLCPILVRRDDELAVLEDALLAAHRGESRLSRSPATQASARHGWSPSSGGALASSAAPCSGAAAARPSSPFRTCRSSRRSGTTSRRRTSRRSASGSARRAGSSRSSFRSWRTGAARAGGRSRAGEAPSLRGGRGFARSRGRRQPVLLVVDDIHWADESTRELLDHLAAAWLHLLRCSCVTYRADELHRRHPLAPVLQSWRRSGLAETVELEPLAPAGVAEMIRDHRSTTGDRGRPADLMSSGARATRSCSRRC